ncbi:MAG: ceramidase domain-containing protein [Chitinophagales bacterium]|nr:ceramidase domain-containing protein [Hyphomicrobiales bacterium]
MEKIFSYCERGSNPAFWAEPLNALTNFGFILAFAVALYAVLHRPKGEHGPWMYFLIFTVFAIGVGSFLFHTLATPQAALADVIPISIFMLTYFAYAMRRFLNLHWALTILATAGFFAILQAAGELRCSGGEIDFLRQVPAFKGTRCLNGSLGYVPAFGAMGLIGGLLALKGHPAARWVLAAALAFAISLTFRTFDREWCRIFSIEGRAIGTHFIWHMLNSVTLFLLLMGAIRHGAYNRNRIESA